MEIRHISVNPQMHMELKIKFKSKSCYTLCKRVVSHTEMKLTPGGSSAKISGLLMKYTVVVS